MTVTHDHYFLCETEIVWKWNFTLSLQFTEQFGLCRGRELCMADVGWTPFPSVTSGTLAVRCRVLPFCIRRPTPPSLHSSDMRDDLILAQLAPLQTLRISKKSYTLNLGQRVTTNVSSEHLCNSTAACLCEQILVSKKKLRITTSVLEMGINTFPL